MISVALNLQKHAHNELQKANCDSLAFSDTLGGTITQSPPTSLYDSDLSTHNLEQSNNNDDGYVVLPEFVDECDRSHYLLSKFWWAGILLMTIGNFYYYYYFLFFCECANDMWNSI